MVRLTGRWRSIAFMGLDGSGKSTQAELLWRHVSGVGGHWAMIHHSSTRLPVIGRLKQRFHRRAIELLKRHRAHVDVVDRESKAYGGGTTFSWVISTYLVLGSFVKAAWYRCRFFRAPGLILDRCFLDDLVKVQWRFGCSFPGAGILLRIAPRPDIVFMLTGEPQTTYGRKKHRNCTYGEYLRKKDVLDRWLAEAALSGWNVEPVVIDGKSVVDVHRTVIDILEACFQRCFDVDPSSRGINVAIQGLPNRKVEPGTPEFHRLLAEALRKRLSGSGNLEVLEGTEVSRNTVIYRCLAGERRLIAKAQMTKAPSVAVAEYRMLREMQHRLNGLATRGLRPVTVLEDLGVLVTEEEKGESLRTLIEEACRRPEEAWFGAVAGVRAAARALREFHNAYERLQSGYSRQPEVRRYLDFSPKNVLILPSVTSRGAPSVVLMDPPEEEHWGSRCEDIGGFCYDLTRVRFLPEFVLRPSVARSIDRLKALFIHQYFLAAQLDDLALVLPEIRAAERRRASQALSWYMRPWRYRSAGKEILRLCYLGPLTAVYRAWGLRFSHSNIVELLQQGETMVAEVPYGRRLPRQRSACGSGTGK